MKLGTAVTPLFLLLAACLDPGKTPPQNVLAGTWRVALTVPGGELPFLMEIRPDESGVAATVINGDQRIETRDVYLPGNSVVINFAVFNSRIDASIERGMLVGSLSFVREEGKRHVIPLRAHRGVTDRFSRDNDPPTIDVTGRWEVVFRSRSGDLTNAVGEFEQNGNKLTGTFLTRTGDYGHLAGNVHGNRIWLSCFDGYHLFLFYAEVDAQGVMRGDLFSGLHRQETWTGVRNETASLPDPNALTFIKPGFDRLNFSFPDTTGTLVSLSDPKFDGKAVLVSVSTTWCPNSHDEAALLRSLYSTYHDRGLEVVTIMYEHVEDFEPAARQVREFARRHDVKYDLLIGGSSDKAEASKTLPMLNEVVAFPTTIFVDRNRKVRRIRTGFTGPAAGQHYRDLVNDYSSYVEFLLSEPFSRTEWR